MLGHGSQQFGDLTLFEGDLHGVPAAGSNDLTAEQVRKGPNLESETCIRA